LREGKAGGKGGELVEREIKGRERGGERNEKGIRVDPAVKMFLILIFRTTTKGRLTPWCRYAKCAV